MAGESLQQGIGGSGESKALRQEERIETEFRHIVRIYARDFEAVKNSFEEWAGQWE